MSQTPKKRGRPKGSGIDDTIRLEAMAELMEKDTRMKPTTAIKALGITDTSTIRRLRDKFNSLKEKKSKKPSYSLTTSPAEVCQNASL